MRRRLARAALMLYPITMGFAPLSTGERYTIDSVLGWLYAYTVFRVISHLSTRAGAPTNLAGASARMSTKTG